MAKPASRRERIAGNYLAKAYQKSIGRRLQGSNCGLQAYGDGRWIVGATSNSGSAWGQSRKMVSAKIVAVEDVTNVYTAPKWQTGRKRVTSPDAVDNLLLGPSIQALQFPHQFRGETGPQTPLAGVKKYAF